MISESIIKYDLRENDIIFFKKYSNKSNLEKIQNKYIFYTNQKWSTKNNNYIYDILLDKYYIVDKDYYYYIPDKRYKLVINNNINVMFINFNENNDKINLI